MVYDLYNKANRFMERAEETSPNGDTLAEFRAFAIERGYSPNSIPSYHKAVRTLDDVTGGKKLGELDAADIEMFLQDLSRLAPITQRGYRVSLRRLLQWLNQRGAGPGEEPISAFEDKESDEKEWQPHRKADVKLPPYLTKKELTTIQTVCSDEKWKALFACLYATGARISELLLCNVGDVEIEERDGDPRAKWTIRTSKTTPRCLPWIKEGAPEPGWTYACPPSSSG